ncbi:MAG: hypothetical protein JW953_05265 [Anaerolineae bacterium]|nr:hypothetical protein [Anaerolineae bacterium]
MTHHYNALEVLELILVVWIIGPVVVLIWLASRTLVDFLKRLLRSDEYGQDTQKSENNTQ